MNTLFELVNKCFSDLIPQNLNTFIISGSCGYKELDNFNLLLNSVNLSSNIPNSKLPNAPLIVAKNSQTLFKFTTSIKTLILVGATNENVLWEDNDTAKLSQYHIITIFDGHELIRKHGYGLCLSGVNLRGAQLQGAKLQGADLSNADLRGCNLVRANMKESSLVEANLEGADLSYANLYAANFELADVRRANLKYSDARKTSWKGAALRGAELWGSFFWKVNLDNSFTDGVDLTRADLRGN